MGKGDSSVRILIDEERGSVLWHTGVAKAGFFGKGVKECCKLPACNVIVFIDAWRTLRAVPAPERSGVGRSAIRGVLGRAEKQPPALLRNDEGVRPMPPRPGNGDASLAVYSTEFEGLALFGMSDTPSSGSVFTQDGGGARSSRRHISNRRQPNLCIPIERKSSSVRVQSILPLIAFARRISTTSDAMDTDEAHVQTSSQVHSASLAGRLFGLCGIGGAKVRPSTSTRSQVPSVSCRQSSTRLGSAVPPVPSVTPSKGLAGEEAAGDSSISAAAFPFPTKTQSLLYLSHILERPFLSPAPLPADPVESL
jgi:hypothetical protein|mmetsp:Transcript_93853/g.148262  ORF Transcript_93853/g.148262 Transcript_93853/m.148262 type:complete len:309 (-) Transcript_93853:71-997(-)